jgi:hypothetical protein
MAASSWTFKEIQDFVTDQLQEVLSAPDMSTHKIKKYINLGYVDFCRRTKMLTDSYDITTVANQVSYSIYDANFANVTHVRYIEDSSTEYGIPLRLFPGGFANLPRDMEFGEPYYYWVRYTGDNTATEIGTVPVASTADETLTVWGYTLPTVLSTDNQTPLLKQDYQEAMILYPVWKLCNAYAHKSKAIREKAREARNEYIDLVQDALKDTSSFSTDDISTVDEYSAFDPF